MTTGLAAAGQTASAGAAAATGASAAIGQLVKATLAELPSVGANPSAISQDANAGPLEFDFNPEKITMKHTQKFKSGGAADRQSRLDDLGDTEITLDKVTFTGLLTQTKCQRLLQWSLAQPDIGEGETVTSPSTLVFVWGTAHRYEVQLRTVNINYIRFAPNGSPTRAEVSLTLVQPNGQNSPAPGANPTSGGPPGRSTRVLDSSGCLASVAYSTYDRPGAWRLIARANDIDDPLRVRPGTVLYLPQRAESRDAARGIQ